MVKAYKILKKDRALIAECVVGDEFMAWLSIAVDSSALYFEMGDTIYEVPLEDVIRNILEDIRHGNVETEENSSGNPEKQE